MLANCGYPVVDLRRDKFGPVLLADLEEGAFRPVDDDDSLIWLNNLL
jgi:16S rRNA U516 pseudouridylate synthase RsuA-like enzyme